MKDTVLTTFQNPQGTLRVVIATVALGMGLDCPNVRHIYHWRASNDAKAYIQETRRVRSDDEPAEALIKYYVTTHPENRFVDNAMKEYSKNKDKCRRELLLTNFDGSVDFCHNSSCCDICELACTCLRCS